MTLVPPSEAENYVDDPQAGHPQRLEPTSDERYLVSTAHSGNAQRDPAKCLARQQTHPEQLPPPSTQNFAQCG